MSKYKELREIDVSKHTEKKGKFTYLSWAWGVDTLLQHDGSATWEYKEPLTLPDGSMPEGDVLERIENVYKEQGIDEARKYFNTLDGDDRKLCTPFIEKVKEK